MRQRAVRHSRLDQTFAALADPTRRRLLERIAQRSERAGSLGRGLPMSRPAVSKHLRILRQAGLVEAVPDGREMRYRLARRNREIAEMRAYVERLSGFWDVALHAFKAFAEREGSS